MEQENKKRKKQARYLSKESERKAHQEVGKSPRLLGQ